MRHNLSKPSLTSVVIGNNQEEIHERTNQGVIYTVQNETWNSYLKAGGRDVLEINKNFIGFLEPDFLHEP